MKNSKREKRKIGFNDSRFNCPRTGGHDLLCPKNKVPVFIKTGTYFYN